MEAVEPVGAAIVRAVFIANVRIPPLSLHSFKGKHRVGIVETLDDLIRCNVMTAVQGDAESLRGLMKILQNVHVVGNRNRLGAVLWNVVVPGGPGSLVAWEHAAVSV